MEKSEKRATFRNRVLAAGTHTYYRKKAKVPCPNCGFDRLIDAGCSTRTRTYLPGETGYEDADYFQKCSRCKTEIGIRKINNTI